MKPIDSAVKLFGTQIDLARALGVSAQVMHKWVKHGRVPVQPVNWVLKLELLTDGKVKRHELRPDIYPAEDGAEQ